MTRTYYNADDLDTIADQVYATSLAAIADADVDQVEAGLGWYAVAHEHARQFAKDYGITVRQAAGVIAVLSPMTRWAQNLEAAEAVLDGDGDLALSHCYASNVAKAMAVLRGDESAVAGPKVTAFRDCIEKPRHTNAVVVDTWMLRAFLLTGQDYSRKGVYEAVARGIRAAAAYLAWRPHQVQATVWIVTRGKAQ